MQTRNATENLEMLHFMRLIRSTPGITSFNMEIFKSEKLFPTLAKHTIFTMQTRNATELLEMLHFMRSIRSTPQMTSFNMDILKSQNLLFPLLQNIPFSPCKQGIRQKSSKCSISCVRSVVLLELHRSTWTSSNLKNFFPLLQNIPFSPCKLGMRQKSSKCSISCVRSVVLLK